MSNKQSINLKRTVFDKNAFENTVNTDFTQLLNPPDPSFFDINLATLEDFWILYNKFFYEIPKEGEINSHEYLAKTSGEYINYVPQQEEIESLLSEIADLRNENLEVRQEIVQVIEDFSNQQQG
jgi:hypothetical protein